MSDHAGVLRYVVFVLSFLDKEVRHDAKVTFKLRQLFFRQPCNVKHMDTIITDIGVQIVRDIQQFLDGKGLVPSFLCSKVEHKSDDRYRFLRRFFLLPLLSFPAILLLLQLLSIGRPIVSDDAKWHISLDGCLILHAEQRQMNLLFLPVF